MADQQTVEFIKSSLSQGLTKEDVYKDLLGRGMTIEAIAENYFAATEAPVDEDDTQKKTIQIVFRIGIVLIGAGIFSFIAANWQVMDKFTKIFLILSGMLVSYVIGWMVKERTPYQKTGDAFIALGAVIYGSGIFLIGQIFNVRANWPDGFLLWMVGVLALAYATSLYKLFSMALMLGFVAAVGYPTGVFGSLRGYNPYLLTSTFLLIAVTAITFWVGRSLVKSTHTETEEVA